jgi:hypothetical protein
MADFTGVIRRAVEGLATNTPEARQKVYNRARQTIERQLLAMPSAAGTTLLETQMAKIDVAIVNIEKDYADSGSDSAAPVAEIPQAPMPATMQGDTFKPSAPEPAPEPEPVPEPTPVIVEPSRYEPPTIVEEIIKNDAQRAPFSVSEEESLDASPVVEDRFVPEAANPFETKSSADTGEQLMEKLTDRFPPALDGGDDLVAKTEPLLDTPSAAEQAINSELEIPKVDAGNSDVADDASSFDAKTAASASAIFGSSVSSLDDSMQDTAKKIADEVSAKVDGGFQTRSSQFDPVDLTDDSMIEQAVGDLKSSLETGNNDLDQIIENHDDSFGFGAEALPEVAVLKPKKSPIVIVVALALILIAAGAYGFWRVGTTGIQDMYSSAMTKVGSMFESTDAPDDGTLLPVTNAEDNSEQSVPDVSQTDVAALSEDGKFTQRLNSDGSEIDEGPASDVINGLPGQEGQTVTAQSDGQNGTPVVGEPTDIGTSSDTDTALQNTGDGSAVIEKMLFYETSLGLEQQAKYDGSVVWSEETESDASVSRPYIKGEIQVPDRDLSVVVTIKLNGDNTLPVSHLIDINFVLPEGFEGGEIEQINEVMFKNTEENPGDRLAAISAKIGPAFFVVGLENDDAQIVATNLQLIGQRNWIDIPISYTNGRKALITLEKGASGNAIFNNVLSAWERNPTE